MKADAGFAFNGGNPAPRRKDRMTGFRTGAPAPEAARYTGPGRFYSGSPGRGGNRGGRRSGRCFTVGKHYNDLGV